MTAGSVDPAPGKAAQRGVLLNPEIKLGEACMDGALRVEQGTIADLLGIVGAERIDDRRFVRMGEFDLAGE